MAFKSTGLNECKFRVQPWRMHILSNEAPESETIAVIDNVSLIPRKGEHITHEGTTYIVYLVSWKFYNNEVFLMCYEAFSKKGSELWQLI